MNRQLLGSHRERPARSADIDRLRMGSYVARSATSLLHISYHLRVGVFFTGITRLLYRAHPARQRGLKIRMVAVTSFV